MRKTKKAKKSPDDVYDFEDSGDAGMEGNNETREITESDDDSMVLTRLRKKSRILSPNAPQTRSGSKQTKSDVPLLGQGETLYCICRKPFDNRFMIECDTCHEWFHGDCIGISLRQGKLMEKRNEEYVCDSCKDTAKESMNAKTTVDERNDDHADDDDDDDDELVSLATIRQKSSQKVQLKEEENGNSNDKSANSTLLSQVISGIKDFSSLLSGERMLAEKTSEHESHASKSNGVPKTSTELVETKTNKTGATVTDIDDINSESEEIGRSSDVMEVEDCKLEPSDDGVIEVAESAFEDEERSTEADKIKNDSDEPVSTPASSFERSQAQQQTSEKTAAVGKIQESPSVGQLKKVKDSVADRCIFNACENRQMSGSIYCSPKCIKAHCEQSVQLNRLNEARLKGKSTSTGQAEIRLSVIDVKTGRFINDHKLVNEKTIEKFIAKHPTFRIVTPKVVSSGLSQQSSQPPSSSTITTSKKSMLSGFRLNVRQELRDALKLRIEGSEDLIGMYSAAEINRTALRIEEAMFKLLGGSQGEKYKQRFRCLILNIKDQRNKTLFKRILNGSFSPEDLATAPAERFASEELAKWREKQRKQSLQMIINAETNPQASIQEPAKPSATEALPTAKVNIPSLTHHDLSNLDESFKIDTTANHRSHLFDVNCKLCTGRSEQNTSRQPPPSAPAPKPKISVYSVLANEPIVSASMSSTQSTIPNSSNIPTTSTDTATLSSLAQKTRSSPRQPSPPQDCNSNLQTVPISPPPPQLEVEWNGFLKPDILAPSSSISGRLISVTSLVHLQNFPETLEVIGKLGTLAVWDYLDKIRRSGNKEIVVVILEPSNGSDSSVSYRSILASLKEKNRYAVARTSGVPMVGGFKDIYMTFTNAEWMRRMTALGVKFTEQIPAESKLASILVRYTTLPVSSSMTSQQQPSHSTYTIPLDKEDSKNSSDEEEEEYQEDVAKPVASHVTTEIPIEPQPYIVKSNATSSEVDNKVPSSDTSIIDQNPSMASILSTPEEVSSVSAIISRILGGSTTTSSSDSTAAMSTSTDNTPIVAPVAKNNVPVVEHVKPDVGLPPALPTFPPFPPPPNFIPPMSLPGQLESSVHPQFPPFPVQSQSSSLVSDPRKMKEESKATLGNWFPPFPPPPDGFFPSIVQNANSNTVPNLTAQPSSFHNSLPVNTESANQENPEGKIRNYLDRLMDQRLSLVVRSNLLQDLARLLQDRNNEDIVRKNPELNDRFKKAVDLINFHMDNEHSSNNSEQKKPALLPTPKQGLLVSPIPPRKEETTMKEAVKQRPRITLANCDQSIVSEWRQLHRSYRERCKSSLQNGAHNKMDTPYSDPGGPRKRNSLTEDQFSGQKQMRLEGQHPGSCKPQHHPNMPFHSGNPNAVPHMNAINTQTYSHLNEGQPGHVRPLWPPPQGPPPPLPSYSQRPPPLLDFSMFPRPSVNKNSTSNRVRQAFPGNRGRGKLTRGMGKGPFNPRY